MDIKLDRAGKLRPRTVLGGIKLALLAAVATFGLTAAASASTVTGQISVGGYAEAVGGTGMGTSTGIDFASGSPPAITGTSGGIYSFAAGTGSFAALGSCASTTGTCGTIQDIANFATEAATPDFLTFNTGGPVVAFNLTSITDVGHATDLNGGSVTLTALGTIDFTGYDPTLAQFILTAQGNNIVSFSATASATAPLGDSTTPIPASLPLFATGLGALGLIAGRRKRKNQKTCLTLEN